VNCATTAALLLCALAAACTSTGDKTTEPVLVYPISANDADTIVQNAMRPEFKATAVQRLTAPHMGYKGTLVAAADSIAIRAYRIQAKGQRRDGSTVPGFYFEVSDSGNSEAGASAVERIRTRITAAAKREAGGLPKAVAAPAQ